MPKTLLCLFTLFFGLFVTFSYSQTCEPPPIVFNTKTDNIFTPEQEMILGDVMFERAESDYQVIHDERINAYLQQIGDRISKNLPDVGLKYKFTVVDMPTTNAFSMAGGRIMITRKMISFVRNEDELAGVIGHELGHSVVRHSAIDISRYFRELLGVSSVGDRNDIFEKYNRFLESRATKNIKIARNHMDNKQLEADNIGIYAAYAAGYDPSAFANFWARFTDAKDKGLFSKLFGTVKPEDKRLKEILAALKNIPTECREKLSTDEKEKFQEWRTAVISFSGLGEKESLSGLVYKRPLVPLRGDIEHLRFSPNGKYILAQDNSSITVLQREPLSVLFRIDANDSLPASFSADSKNIIVTDQSDRIQEWNVGSHDLVAAKDYASAANIWLSQVSPDGKYVVVYKMNGDLVVYDSENGVEVILESGFHKPNGFEEWLWHVARNLSDSDELGLLNIRFSESGRYMLVGFGSEMGVKIFSSLSRNSFLMSGFASKREGIAFDLKTRQKLKIGNSIKNLIYYGGNFIGDDKIVGKTSDNISKSGLFSFPSGDRISEFELSGRTFMPAEFGPYITVRPVSKAPVAIFDLNAKKYILANKKSALDVYGETFIAERQTGELAIYDLKTNQPISTIELPPSPLGSLRTVSISRDGNWLALSEKSRGAAWNLQTSKPIFHVRSFRGSYFSPEEKLYADFPKEGDADRTVASMDLKTLSIARGAYDLGKGNVRQYGKYIVTRTSKETEKDRKEESTKPREYSGGPRDALVGFDDVTFTIRDTVSGSTLWEREFPGTPPRYIVDTTHGTMTFYWYADNKTAKKIIDANPELKAAAADADSSPENIVVEIVDPNNGNVLGHFYLNTGEGSFSVSRISAAGDYLTVTDNTNRSLIYSISTGKLVRRFFGGNSEISVEANLIAVENPTGQINVYDLKTGAKRVTLSFTRPIAILRFLQNGKHMFILTTDQVAYMFDTDKFAEVVR